MRSDEGADDPSRLARAAGVIFLLRGTGLASAGVLAAITLIPEGDPERWWTLLLLGAGALLALLSVPMMAGRRLALAAAAPIVLAYVLLVLNTAWNVRDVVEWLAPLPAAFLPDLYAVWTLLRRRGRLLVARAMVVLAAGSSLALAWLGAAWFLA